MADLASGPFPAASPTTSFELECQLTFRPTIVDAIGDHVRCVAHGLHDTATQRLAALIVNLDVVRREAMQLRHSEHVVRARHT